MLFATTVAWGAADDITHWAASWVFLGWGVAFTWHCVMFALTAGYVFLKEQLK